MLSLFPEKRFSAGITSGSFEVSRAGSTKRQFDVSNRTPIRLTIRASAEILTLPTDLRIVSSTGTESNLRRAKGPLAVGLRRKSA
jgi:hypothetical protein